MILSSWLPGVLGRDDEGEALDPASMSKREIDQQVFTIERELDRIGADIDRRKQEYRTHLQEGAKAAPGKQRVHAIRARLEKFKAQIQELQRLQAIKELSIWVAIKGQSELREMMDSVETSVDIDDMINIDLSEFQAQMDDLQHDIQYGMEEVTSLMAETDVRIDDVSVSLSEEEALMNQMAAGQVDDAALDLELQFIETDDTGIDLDDVADGSTLEGGE